MSWIPKAVSIVSLWGAVVWVIVTVDPILLKDVGIAGAYLPFYILLAITLWYTLSVITKAVFKSLILTITMIGGLILTMTKIMHWGLAIVLILTLVIESWYIYRKK